MPASTALTWERISAIPGWFTISSYGVWRALLDFQEDVRGDVLEIGIWRGRSTAVLAGYRRPGEKLYLCDLNLDEGAVHSALRSVGASTDDLVPLSGPSAGLEGRLNLSAMRDSIRWMHIDGEHTGATVSRELALANRVLHPDGILVIDDFFSPRYPANTTETMRYLDRHPLAFRLFAVAFNKAYLCRPPYAERLVTYLRGAFPAVLRSHGPRGASIYWSGGPWAGGPVGMVNYQEAVGSPTAGSGGTAPPGWLTSQTLATWRALLDGQRETGDVFDIGTRMGQSTALLAGALGATDTLHVWDPEISIERLREYLVHAGVTEVSPVAVPGRPREFESRMDLRALHARVRWLHLDSERVGSDLVATLEFADRVIGPRGIVAVSDFFSARRPAVTIDLVKFLDQNPFAFRLFATGFEMAYLCRPEAMPHFVDYMAGGFGRALARRGGKATIYKTTGPWDDDAVGIAEYNDVDGPIAGPDDRQHIWHTVQARPVGSLWRRLRRRLGF